MSRGRGRRGGDRGRTPPDISHLHSIMVFNISYRTRKEELYRTFDRFGDIADVYIPRDRHGESRGFGFVRFYEKRDADDAKTMDGRMVDGRRIGVQMAKYGRRHESKRGGYGGRGGGGYGGRRRQRSYSRSRSRSRGRYQSRSRSRSRSGHYRRRYYSRSRSRSMSNDRHNDKSSYRRRSFSRSRSRSPSNHNVKRENNVQPQTMATNIVPNAQSLMAQNGIPAQNGITAQPLIRAPEAVAVPTTTTM